MALSNKEISALYFEALGSQHLREQDRKMVTRFAHAVEADVRKRDEALIRQLVEALEDFDDAGPLGEGWKSDRLLSLLASARAWLEGKP